MIKNKAPISDGLPHMVACGMAGQMRLATQSVTPNSTAARMML